MSPSPEGNGTTIYERLESRRAGRALITILIVVTLAAIVSTTMPSSALKDRLVVWATPYVEATGVYQDWTIFSPNPRQETWYILGRLDHSDGTVTEWAIVTDPGFPFSWDYRWQKFEEGLSNPNNAWARASYARWLAKRDLDAGHQPTHVRLVRRSAPSLPPGSVLDRGAWEETVLFEESVSQ